MCGVYMKKIFSVLVTFFFIISSIFAISDATLHLNESTYLVIKNNQLFDGEELFGIIETDGTISLVEETDDPVNARISEDAKSITLTLSSQIEDDDNVFHEMKIVYKFNKANGFLTYYEDPSEKKSFYEETGLLQDLIWHS